MTNDNVAVEFGGYSTFQDVDDRKLRAWNQYNVLCNLNESKLDDVGAKYISLLTIEDRVALVVIIEYVNIRGYDETKRQVITDTLEMAA